ncbi:MAG: diaminopimelate epimerase [Alphaproteobacteria bacterium]|nr:diaminopimelate epimerase [Alphaproteobacteria bacterium]
MKFYKMHGLGNDYIYFDCISEKLPIEKIIQSTIQVSKRHTGIGSDGIVLILPSDKADIKMRMFNSIDGKEAEMCGNAVRCVSYLANKLNITKEAMTVETIPGIISSEIIEENVKVKMFYPPKVQDQEMPISSCDKNFDFNYVDVGNPHAVIRAENIDKLEIEKYGKPIENNTNTFPNKTNVEFYEEISKGILKMRVWERGSGETMACGTGACATAGAYRLKNKECNEITVKMLGGDLQLLWQDNNFYMIGPAKFVFAGEIYLENL